MAREHDRARSSTVAVAASPPSSFPKRFGFRARSASRSRTSQEPALSKKDLPPEPVSDADADRRADGERGRIHRTDASGGTATGSASPALQSSSKLPKRNASRDPDLSGAEREETGIIKRMTTRIRRRVSGALPQVPAHSASLSKHGSPPLPNEFTNKELREKALRERGLLPTRDLSAQEAARDQCKTYVKPLSDEEAGRGGKTAAMRVREEYEARERELRSVPPSDECEVPRMDDVAGTSTNEAQDVSRTLTASPVSEKLTERAVSSPSIVTTTQPQQPHSQSLPSPTSPTTSGSFSDRFARLPPHPTKRPPPPPIQISSSPATPVNATPKLLPSPPPHVPSSSAPLSPTASRPGLIKSNSTSTRNTTDSEVPSLSLSASDSSSVQSPASPRDVELQDMRRRASLGPIDGVLGNPQEAFTPLQRIAEMEMRAGCDEHGVARGRARESKTKTLPLPPAHVTARPVSAAPSEASSTEKRKSFALFSRRPSGSASDSEGPSLKKGSFTSLRRTLNGGEKRPKTSYNPPPSSFAGRHRGASAPAPRPPSEYVDDADSKRPGVGLRRAPANPTMHSRGSILLEMKGIEDSESRRLSEMAFLD
ncbi:hypothetical protein GLOTRDRAFT_140391 [Gloeophyllum trabeum ATCC 11539]|uniref:Uncharacterized protein n=1 Tax=Gloeophyllum trabeum (strain ATCC 11539 / FP-39264 / Madison 617) TaxID=670483 RepID=S7PYN0_GLOTA|nr:uncharacterized protein GLOTRDRAFT_140391 [Gloeophyllum trabeum ATCC 11539]EPQ52761.1 hypothetical protein GLOTRDRAFT_140391 [Gloeophyllum trabeum ATCC 11539]